MFSEPSYIYIGNDFVQKYFFFIYDVCLCIFFPNLLSHSLPLEKVIHMVWSETYTFMKQCIKLIYITNQPTPWDRILLQKQRVTQLVKEFPAFYRIQIFTIMFTRAHHWSTSWDSKIQFILSHSSHLCLSLKSHLFMFSD